MWNHFEILAFKKLLSKNTAHYSILFIFLKLRIHLNFFKLVKKLFRLKKLIPFLVFALLTAVAVESCERDDICPESTPTTPRLKIDFMDNSNPDDPKNVTFLRIQGLGHDTHLGEYSGSAQYTDSIALPLKTDDTVTQYSLIKDYDEETDPTSGNADTITIQYTTKEIYVSRACGYKHIFENVSVAVEPDDDNWIQLIQSVTENQTVEDENSAHFTISH